MKIKQSSKLPWKQSERETSHYMIQQNVLVSQEKEMSGKFIERQFFKQQKRSWRLVTGWWSHCSPATQTPVLFLVFPPPYDAPETFLPSVGKIDPILKGSILGLFWADPHILSSHGALGRCLSCTIGHLLPYGTSSYFKGCGSHLRKEAWRFRFVSCASDLRTLPSAPTAQDKAGALLSAKIHTVSLAPCLSFFLLPNHNKTTTNISLVLEGLWSIPKYLI